MSFKNRPFAQSGIAELETLAGKDVATDALILGELRHRNTARAVRLRDQLAVAQKTPKGSATNFTQPAPATIRPPARQAPSASVRPSAPMRAAADAAGPGHTPTAWERQAILKFFSDAATTTASKSGCNSRRDMRERRAPSAGLEPSGLSPRDPP